MADSIQFRRGLRGAVKPLPVGMPGFIEDEERLVIGKGDGTNTELPNKADMDNINSQMADIVQVNVRGLGFLARGDGSTDDTQALLNAIEAANNIKLSNNTLGKYRAVIYFPPGVYNISQKLLIPNGVSVLLHKNAVLNAIAQMDYVMEYDGGSEYNNVVVHDTDDSLFDDKQIFIKGGTINGNNLASTLKIGNYKHFTLQDLSLFNGKIYGLRIGGDGQHGYELVGNNLYFKCTNNASAGNIALYTSESDSHFTDCISVDYTVGFRASGSANRFTRCHEWGTFAEVLNDSLGFDMQGNSNSLVNCYADTAKKGYNISGDTELIGCNFYNNYTMFGLTDCKAIYYANPNAKLKIIGGSWNAGSPSDEFWGGYKPTSNVSVSNLHSYMQGALNTPKTSYNTDDSIVNTVKANGGYIKIATISLFNWINYCDFTFEILLSTLKFRGAFNFHIIKNVQEISIKINSNSLFNNNLIIKKETINEETYYHIYSLITSNIIESLSFIINNISGRLFTTDLLPGDTINHSTVGMNFLKQLHVINITEQGDILSNSEITDILIESKDIGTQVLKIGSFYLWDSGNGHIRYGTTYPVNFQTDGTALF